MSTVVVLTKRGAAVTPARGTSEAVDVSEEAKQEGPTELQVMVGAVVVVLLYGMRARSAILKSRSEHRARQQLAAYARGGPRPHALRRGQGSRSSSSGSESGSDGDSEDKGQVVEGAGAANVVPPPPVSSTAAPEVLLSAH